MRNIIDVLDNLMLESVGLANRTAGDVWISDRGDKIVFLGLKFYPARGQYNTPEELQQAIVAAGKEINVPVENMTWSNRPQGAGAFGIAHFKDADDDSKQYYLNRYFKEINPNRAENKFPNDLVGGFKLQSASAVKERSGYKPSEVLSKLDNLSPSDIVSQIKTHFGNDSDESRAIDMFVRNDPTDPIPLGNMNYNAFTNYFCEILQPLALVLGKPVKGNASDAEKIFFGNTGFSTCKISFGGSKIGGLVDSTLTNPDGNTIGISTKAKGGATASSKNLDDKVKEMRNNTDGQKILKKYKTEVALIELIVSSGMKLSPLNLAVVYKIITPKEKDQVLALANLGPEDQVVGAGILSKNLEKLYNARTSTDVTAIVPFYHMLAAVAFPVADYVNENTNFSSAAAEILNFGAFMQAYTNATKRGDNIIINEFDFEYPSSAVTKVLLSAKKTYYSTGNKGNFTFKLLKNNATEDDVEIADTDSSVPHVPAQTSAADLDTATQKRSSVTARAGGAEAEKPPRDNEKVFGRKRQR